MAINTAVNSQITDSVTQANTKVLGDSPAMAMGNLIESNSQALSDEERAKTVNAPAEVEDDLDTASTGEATSKIFQEE